MYGEILNCFNDSLNVFVCIYIYTLGIAGQSIILKIRFALQLVCYIYQHLDFFLIQTTRDEE